MFVYLCVVGNYLAAFTPDDFRYQYVWKSTQNKNSQFRFLVLACHDVHINMSPREGEVYYEAVLGGWNNTMSVIRLANVHMQEYLETGIVHCNEFRQFWISWTEATIRVGKGTELFQSTFLEWNDSNFAGVNHLSFSCGYGSYGIWAFNENLGHCSSALPTLRFQSSSTSSSALLPLFLHSSSTLLTLFFRSSYNLPQVFFRFLPLFFQYSFTYSSALPPLLMHSSSTLLSLCFHSSYALLTLYLNLPPSCFHSSSTLLPLLFHPCSILIPLFFHPSSALLSLFFHSSSALLFDADNFNSELRFI